MTTAVQVLIRPTKAKDNLWSANVSDYIEDQLLIGSSRTTSNTGGLHKTGNTAVQLYHWTLLSNDLYA